MRSVLNLFGFTDPSQIPIFVLSDDGAVYSSLASSMRAADLNARVVLPNVRTVTAKGKSGIEWIYDYRAAIGLGLIALDERDEELNIFENVYKPSDQEQKKHWLLSPKVAGAVACVMLLVLAIVSYAIDLKSPKSIMDRVQASTVAAKTDLDALVQRQRLIKTVARERPDMLALMKTINECGDNGVQLNSIHFKKDQKVSITGQVKSNDQLYKFQENLDDHKDITEAEIQNTGKVSSKGGGPSGRPGGPPGDPPSGGGSRGKGGITFTITFHYKNFTRKLTREQSLRAG
jgi:Tfp pilus assembly protein PilN